jgi:hypothetical protein
LLKTRNSASFLNTLYIAESAQFYSAFSLITITVTRHFCNKAKFHPAFFAENAQYDLKTRIFKTTGKFHLVFSATALTFATRFRRNVVDTSKYLGEFKKYF